MSSPEFGRLWRRPRRNTTREGEGRGGGYLRTREIEANPMDEVVDGGVVRCGGYFSPES